jgi:hypothetical protein
MNVDDSARGRVTYRRYVSDGNYGTEGAEVSLEVTVSESGDDWSEESVEATLESAKRLVYAKLAESPSYAVRRAVEAPKPDVWKQAEQSAEVELAAGLRDNARGDDDPEDTPF